MALAGLPFEESVVQRSSLFDYSSKIVLRTCSAEDLIVLKAFAGRGQDWVDVEGVIVRQTGTLDWRYVSEQLGPLAELKEDPEILDQLERNAWSSSGKSAPLQLTSATPQVELFTNTPFSCEMINTKRGRDVLQRNAVRFEQRDLFIARATAIAACDDSAELGH